MIHSNAASLLLLHWLQSESKTTSALGQIQMSAGQLLLTILGSAGVGALVSSVFTAFDRWLERTARERELLFRSALEISKATAERANRTSEQFVPGLEMFMVERTFEILKQVYETGKMSGKNRTYLTSLAKKKDDEDRKT